MANNPYLDLLEQGQSANADAGTNPYLDLASGEAAQGQATLRASATVAIDANPDEVARQRRVAGLLNVPVAAVEALPDETARQAKLAQIERDTRNAAALRLAMSNPEFARLAHDDTENLSLLEQGVRAFEEYVVKPVGKYAIRPAAEIIGRTEQGFYGLAAGAADVAEAAVDPLVGRLLPANPISPLARQLQQFADEGKRYADYYGVQGNAPEYSGVVDISIAQGIASAGQNLVLLPFSLQAQGVGMAGQTINTLPTLRSLAPMGAMTAGQSYTDAKAAGLPLADRLAFAGQQGGVEMVTEALPLGRLLTDIKANSPLLPMLAKQLTSENIGEQVATHWQDANEWLYLNPDKSLADYLEERPMAALQTAIATTVATGLQTGAVRWATRRDEAQRAEAAERQAQHIEQFNQRVAASKVLQRDADTVEKFVESATAEGADSLYIGGRELMQSGVGEAVARLSPTAGAQLEEALATGGQVRIPLSEYTARIAGTEYAQALVDHLKVDPEGFSLAEAREYLQTQGEQLKAEVEQVLTAANVSDEFRASQDALKQAVLANLNEAGRFSPQTNEVYAELIAARTSARAARLGLTPEALFAKDLQTLRVRAEGQAAARVLSQGEGAAHPFAGFTREQFLGSPRITSDANGATLRPRVLTTVEAAESEPFAVGNGLTAKYSEDGAAVFDGDKLVASYNFGDTLVVDKKYRRQGIAEEMVYQWRTRNPQAKPARERTRKSQALQEKVWARIEREMLDQAAGNDLYQTTFDQEANGATPYTADTIEVDGKTRPVVNSSGQRIAQTEEGLRAFWRWFGDSKVVDAEGRPLVVYHGTKGGFSTFDSNRQGQSDFGASGRGFYFSQDPDTANVYAVLSPGDGNANIMPVYVSIQNPYELGALLPQSESESRLLTERVKSEGYNGIIAVGVDGNLNEIVAFDPTQIKSVFNQGTFDPANPNILYQSGQQGPRLSAIHNLSAENLAFADKMGGIAVPSIGVVTAEAGGVDGFGEITLIGTRDMADPRGEPVFSSDAYTARFPKPEWNKVKRQAADKLVAEIRPIADEFDDRMVTSETFDGMVNNPDAGEVISRWLGSNAIQAMFLREKGIDAVPIMREANFDTGLTKEQIAELEGDYQAVVAEWRQGNRDAPIIETVRQKVRDMVEANAKAEGLNGKMLEEYLDAVADGFPRNLFNDRAKVNNGFGVDSWKTREALRPEIEARAAEFKAWVEAKVLPPYGEPFIKVGRQKRPYTLPNIVEVMTDPKVKGQEKTMTYGAGMVRAVTSKQFNDIEEMRAAAATAIADPAEYEKAKKESEAALEAYRDAVIPYTTLTNWRGEPDTWEALDASMRALAKWATGKKRDAAGLRAALRKEGFKVDSLPAGVIEQGIAAGEALLNAPVPYFEAKPQRAVSLDEFAGAVIPANASPEVRAILDKHGIPYREVAEGADRQAAVRGLTRELSGQGAGVLFQSAYHGSPYKFTKFSLEHMGKGEGAQAYGWGLYFASQRGIAEHYRQTLSGTKFVEKATGKLVDSRDIPMDQMRNLKRDYEPATGQLYEVNIPDEGYLLWDKPLSEQPEAVRTALENADVMDPSVFSQYTGEQFYEGMVRDAVTFDGMSRPAAQEKASKFLNSIGITGIQYLDGTSRTAGTEVVDANGNLANLNGERTAEVFVNGFANLDEAITEAESQAKTYPNMQRIADVLREWEGLGYSLREPDAAYNYVIFDDAAIEILQTYYQDKADPRGSFNPDTTVISLLKGVDLSTFLHESGHYFFEADIALASEFLAAGRELTEGEQGLLRDVSTLLKWHGIQGTIEEQLRQWHTMSFAEQEAAHERTAESFEAYLFEGVAPSIELAPYFQKFRGFLTRVYSSLKAFLQRYPEAGKLDDTVRAVFDRMLATDEQIALAQQARSMQAMFRTEADAQAVGMTPEEFAAYQAQDAQRVDDAAQDLQAKALRDLQWTRNARAKEIKKLQRKSAETRREVRMAVRREVMSQPVYRAWQFLTSKITADDKVTAEALPKSAKDAVTPEVDSLFVAIAKLGGITKDDAANTWGITDKINPPLFGKPVLRATGGYSIDAMAEKLGELGYLTLDRDGKVDVREFEELFGDELRGSKRYSNQVDGRVVRADAAMPGEGMDPNAVQAGRLDEASLLEMGLPTEIVDHLRNMRMVAKSGGWHPDLIADRFGFGSGDEMVRTLAAAEAPQVEIEGLTDARMLAEFGELATPAAIEREADKAIHNEARARMVMTEANALAKAAGQRRVLFEAAKQYASEMIARLRVRDVRPGQYTSAAARAGKLADKAMREGNLPVAAAEKRNQVLNTLAAKAAMEARDEVEATVKKWSEFARRADDKLGKGYDMDMVNAVRAILGQYGIAEGKAKKATEYLKAVEAYDPEMYGMLRESVEAAEASAKPYREMTVEEVRTLRDEIGGILHLAKRSREMEVGGDRLDRQDVEDALRDQLEQVGIPDRVPGEGMAVTPAESRMAKFKTFLAAATRMENWTERMDQGKPMGPFKRFVYSVIKDAADAYRTEKAAKLKEFRALVESIAPSLKPQVIAAPELGYTFGKDSGGSAINEILHALLHTGNESNKRKLLLGRGWATEGADGVVNTARWDAFVARMVAEGKIAREHFDFVQGVWDLLESTKPLAQKTHRDVFGKYFDEVTAQEFVDPFGVTRRGGYVPAMVDTRVVKEGELRALAEADNASLSYAFPTTAKGFTKSRVEYNRPLMLDLRTLAQHIDKVLLFSHMEMPVRDVQRVLSGKVGSAIGRIDSTAMAGMIQPWLVRSARQTVETPIAGDGGLMRFFSLARSRAGMAAMFGNLANAVQQVTGFSMAAVKVKPALLTEAMAQYMKGPKALATAVAEASPYMAGRMENEVAVMSDAINDILLNPSLLERGQAWAMHHAYFLQSGIDNVMSPVIWTAAYNQYQAEGYSHEDAVRLADGVVRTTQGSTMPEDISRMESGPAWARLFTQFAGYFNMQANLLGTEFVNLARDMGLRKGAGRGLYVLTMGFLAPAVVGEAVMQVFRGGPDDEDDDGYLDDWLAALFGWAPLRNATAMLPFGTGQLVMGVFNAANDKPYDDRLATSPAISMIETSVKAPVSVYKAIVEDGSPQKAVRDVATLISMTVGLPANLAARPIGYLAGVAADDTVPTGPVDAVRGIVTGTPSAASKQ